MRFVDSIGQPPNIGDIKAAIEAARPAHLTVLYSFRYLSIGEVQALTLGQMNSRQLGDFAPFLD
ncbi:hypothetical protein D3C71_2100910 [compost metagenome]